MAFRRRTKSYPLFSQEFVIHNHADIGFCLVLCTFIPIAFLPRKKEAAEAGQAGEGAEAPVMMH